jgi:conjugative relaxase-like TrwC/TraI family protein
MLRVVAHKSAAAARQYYSEGLRREDYYSEGQEIAGKWHGKAAELLGLEGSVTPEAFAALVENRHPGTGERLTARTKTDRVVGYDLNFHAPKSLSVLYALTGDDEILKAFRSAVAETMGEIESQTATRVRKQRADKNRVTGNFAWAEFVHLTARPVDGIPDPHLHVHCFAFNATFDEMEGRWKAANFRDIKKDAPYSEAAFHSRLTDKLAALGYGIERTRQGWELQGIPRSVIDKFSRRNALIERLAHEKGIIDSEGKHALGLATREGKRHGLAYADLLAAWGERLTPDEKAAISKVRFDKGENKRVEKITAGLALDEAFEKLFEKKSVVEVKRVVAEALHFGVGQVTPEKVWKEFGQREMVVREVEGEMLCTSLDVLAEEISLINYVRSGRGTCAPIKGGKAKLGNEDLSGEQNAAVRHLLNSRDQVMAIRGGAGVGKTTAMVEAVRAIEASGFKVFAFAPSASASRETLREAGFDNAETVAHLLTNLKLQKETRGQVIWIDEAGLLGARDMLEILRIAGKSTRIILTGDTAQHGPVSRGDPFRLMQEYAGMKVVQITEIRRQVRAEYRNVVASLSKGDLRTAFSRLDDLGAIVEIPNEAERYRELAHEFQRLSRKDSVPLVVSPTHAESAKVTAAIRDARAKAGKLGPEKSFLQYHNLQWAAPDKRRAENYREGLIVQFHQNVRGILRGEIFRVAGLDGKGGVRIVGAKGRETELTLKQAERFQVFEEREIKLGKGDRIRITRNEKRADGRRLNNGDLFSVKKFSRDGKIVLNNGAELEANHGHFTYGYCQTSHSSQSKSVRDVLVAQSADSFFSSSREQFYVSVSRGKESIRIFTDNRQGLQEAVGNSSHRVAGIELAGLSARDVASVMRDGPGSRQWRDMVQSRTQGAVKTHVQNMLRERKQDVNGKVPTLNFREFVAMKRSLAGPDGKSRSKSGPSGQGKQDDQNRGRSFLRPIEPRVPHKTAANGNKKAAPEMPARQRRLAKGYEAAKMRFQKVVDKVNGTKEAAKNRFKKATENVKGTIEKVREKRVNQLPKNNTEQISKHGVKQRAADAGAQAKRQAKIQQKQPTPPTPRRGK